MGVFKSMRQLQKQANEIQKNTDMGAQLDDAKTRMAEATDMMAQQTAAANLSTNGLDATASIAAVRQGGAMVNFQPSLELDLTVSPEGLPPYPVTVSQVVPQIYLARAQVGANVAVKIDPNDPATVWIDWARPVG